MRKKVSAGNKIRQKTWKRVGLSDFVVSLRGIRSQKPRRGSVGGCGHIFIERRLLDALFLALRNFATFRYCQEQSNGRCLRDMCIHMPSRGVSTREGKICFVGCTYRRGLLRCSFRQYRAMRRPLSAGRVTGTDSRAFFV